MLQVGKLDAANRQLDFAIDLFFSGGDPVCVHTLAGAASILFSDLVENRHSDRSWDRMIQVDNKLSQSDYFKIARNVQNFLKHAQQDASAILCFNEVETEDLMIVAVLNSGILQMLSVHQSVFELWYLANRADTLGADHHVVKDALNLFPGIDASPPADRRTLGLRVLRANLATNCGDS